MPSMMNSDPEPTAQPQSPPTDEKDWNALYGRIQRLALTRAAALLAEEGETEAFDRGARSLRTLMSAAEIARRMKTQDEKDQALDGGQETRPVITDEAIEEIYRDVAARVERIEQQAQAAHGADDQGELSKTGDALCGNDVEDKRP